MTIYIYIYIYVCVCVCVCVCVFEKTKYSEDGFIIELCLMFRLFYKTIIRTILICDVLPCQLYSNLIRNEKTRNS